MDQPNPPEHSRPMNFVSAATFMYVPMAIAGYFSCVYFHDEYRDSFSFAIEGNSLYEALLISLVASGVLLGASRLFEDWFASFRHLRNSMVKLLGPISLPTAFYLALASSIGEEFFFRAALLPWLGIFFSSVLFGLMHIGPELRLSSWALWAFLAGLLLGWVYVYTGNIWAPVLIHFIVNFVSLCRIRFLFAKQYAQQL